MLVRTDGMRFVLYTNGPVVKISSVLHGLEPVKLKQLWVGSLIPTRKQQSKVISGYPAIQKYLVYNSSPLQFSQQMTSLNHSIIDVCWGGSLYSPKKKQRLF